jgi:predicted tellurium resistance membrane protein TerC
MARSQSRVRNWGTIGAFTLIIAITIGEGVDEGFSLWDWLVMGVSAVFILQAVSRLIRHEARP